MLRKSLLISTMVLLVSSHAYGDDRRADKSRLVIMTFNAQFLWDGVAPEEGSADFSWRGSRSKAEEHMRRVAQIIIASNPDIINLVEVENFQALSRFNNKFLAGQGYRPFLVNGNDSQTGQDVCMLTRIDPDSFTRDNRQGQSGNLRKSVSKNYIAEMRVNNLRIAFIGIHLIAFPKDAERVRQRQAQADAVRSIALEKRNEGFLPVILGDFNDYDGEQESRDHINSTPTSNVLSVLKRMAPNDNSDNLLNAASFIAQAQRFTAWHDANGNGAVNPPKEFTSIDHILLSPELAALVSTVEFPHAHEPNLVSDHFPVVVRLRLTA